MSSASKTARQLSFLRVENLPQAPPPKGQMGLFGEEPD